jgi:hypothetical protein
MAANPESRCEGHAAKNTSGFRVRAKKARPGMTAVNSFHSAEKML